MFACAHCGNELPDGASFCNQCWKPVEPSPTVPAKQDAISEPLVASGSDQGADATTVGAPPSEAPTFQAPPAPPTAGYGDPPPVGYPSAPPPPPPSPWTAPTGPDAWGAPPVADAWAQPTAVPDATGWGAPPGAAAAPWGAPPAVPPVPGSGAWGGPPPPPPGGYGYGVGAYSPSPYAAPGYYAPAGPGTNGMAIASLVCSLVAVFACGISAPLGIIFGHIGLSQIKKTGADGRGLAIAGLVIGYLFLIGIILFIVFAVANSSNSSYN